MKRSIIQSAMLAAALLLMTNLSLASTDKAPAAGEAKAVSQGKVDGKDAKAKGAAPATKVKQVDINSASKSELKTLPGIGDKEAEKIIAGRPYLSKAHLVTNKVIPRGIYENIRTQIIAKQNKATAAKVDEKSKGH